MTTARAPAKVNLALHVTGQRDDGYHLLDSLVVFADVADGISAAPAEDLALTVSGPFAEGVPTGDRNLILRAARALADARGVTAGAALHLEKNLPHAAGIGSGSADAAATLRLLAELWQVTPLTPDDPAVARLGADVPVCLSGPAPQRMSGIGDRLAPIPPLPDCALVLVRPPVAVPTGQVFQGLATKHGTPMSDLPDGPEFAHFAAWLTRQRNDLQTPAANIAPVIATVIDTLQAYDGVAVAAMSGSGATCFGLVEDQGKAADVAARMTAARPDWWVAAGRVL